MPHSVLEHPILSCPVHYNFKFHRKYVVKFFFYNKLFMWKPRQSLLCFISIWQVPLFTCKKKQFYVYLIFTCTSCHIISFLLIQFQENIFFIHSFIWKFIYNNLQFIYNIKIELHTSKRFTSFTYIQ